MGGLGTIYFKQPINVPSKYRYDIKHMINILKNNELIEKYNYYGPSFRTEYKNSKGYKKINKLNPDLIIKVLLSVKVYNSNKILYMWLNEDVGKGKMGFKII